jgi:RNA polymerase sigma factor (sigma-70 family)
MPYTDLVQEVSLAAIETVRSFDLGRNNGFRAHFGWKIRARLKEAARKHVKHNGQLGLSAPGAENEDGEAGDSAADNLVESAWTGSFNERERGDHFYAHLFEPLDDTEREVVRMIKFSRMTQAEAGAALGCSRTQAANICKSAIRKLKLRHADAQVTTTGWVIDGNAVHGPFLPLSTDNAERRRELRLLSGRPCHAVAVLTSHLQPPDHTGYVFVFGYRQFLRHGFGILRRRPSHQYVNAKIGLGIPRGLPLLPYPEPKLGGEPRYTPLTRDEAKAGDQYRMLNDLQVHNLVWRNTVGVAGGERWYRTTTKIFEPAIDTVLLKTLRAQPVEPVRPGGYRIDLLDPVEPQPRWILASTELTEMHRYGRDGQDEMLLDDPEAPDDGERPEKKALEGWVQIAHRPCPPMRTSLPSPYGHRQARIERRYPCATGASDEGPSPCPRSR